MIRRFSMFALLFHITLFCACSSQVAVAQNAKTNVISVKQFGAMGDGVKDDTQAIQKAVDAATVGQTVLFPPGVYIVTSVNLKAGIRYTGQKAIIKRPPNQGKWVRTFTTQNPGYLHSADTDSPLLIIDGLTFDGSRDQQATYSKHELEQAHLIFLNADPTRKGRLRALIRNCRFRECVADGISVYTNVDVQVLDCSSFNCFRGGFVLTGGYTRATVKNFSSAGTRLSAGIDIEVDGKGYGDTLKIALTMQKLRLNDGHFDVAVSDGSQVTISDVISRSGFYIAAPGATVLIQNADLGVGRLSDYWNRVVFPGHTTFKNCRFTLRPELAEAPPKKDEIGSWAALHVFWNISGTEFKDQVLNFLNCDFKVATQVAAKDKTYAFFIRSYAAVDSENTLNVNNCRISADYDYGLYSQTASKINIQNSKIEATNPFYLGR